MEEKRAGLHSSGDNDNMKKYRMRKDASFDILGKKKLGKDLIDEMKPSGTTAQLVLRAAFSINRSDRMHHLPRTMGW
jgi:hypothetical protein